MSLKIDHVLRLRQNGFSERSQCVPSAVAHPPTHSAPSLHSHSDKRLKRCNTTAERIRDRREGEYNGVCKKEQQKKENKYCVNDLSVSLWQLTRPIHYRELRTKRWTMWDKKNKTARVKGRARGFMARTASLVSSCPCLV